MVHKWCMYMCDCATDSDCVVQETYYPLFSGISMQSSRKPAKFSQEEIVKFNKRLYRRRL